jgi:hypothetical protein
VKIGTGGGGTVTLAQDQTIASLSITNGYTLTGSGNSITTTGNVSLASGAALSVDDMNVGGTFTDSGSATLAGVLTINKGGQLTLSNGSITGGINGTGVFRSSAGTTDTLNNVTIYKGTTFTASGGATTDLKGAIVNKGTFVVNGAASNAIVNLVSNLTLSGGGKVTMKSGTSTSAFLRGGGFTLTNAKNTIQGAGNIGDNAALAVVNQGTINANASGQNLNLNQGNGGVTNTGTLEATSGATLQLFNTITNNSGGVITANGGTVKVLGKISGGTLNTLGGGLMESSGSGADLSGVTISSGSTYTAGPSTTTQLDGAIVDAGTLAINGATGNAILNLGSAVTLSGGGAVTLSSGAGGSAYLRGNGVTLTNSNDTIQGAGFIGDSGALAIVNKATIDANSSGQSLNLNQGNGGVTNTGTLEATGGGVLNLNSTVTNQTGGDVTANGGTVNVIGTISGGTLSTLNSGVMESSGGGANLSGVTISSGSTYTAGPGTTTQLNGSIVNDGTFAINGASGNAIVNLGSKVTLSGGGKVTLSSGAGGSAFLRGSGLTLTNTNDTIQGAGLIGDNAALAINNKGTIDANSSGQSLNLGQGGGSLTNTGTFEATGGGHLFVAGALGGAGQLKVGANSTVELGGATSESTTFLSATSGTLLIDNATTTTYSGVLKSFVKGDILELGNTNATSATPTSFNGTNTTLTVDLSSGGPLTYTLAGNLTGDTFGVTHSGSNSSIDITAPVAFAEAFSLLGGHTASPFVESSGVFGASNTAGSAQLTLVTPLHAHS